MQTMVFVIIFAPSCRVAQIINEFQIILELVSLSLIQNVFWKVLSFHVGLKFSIFRLKVFYNEVVQVSVVQIQIKVKKWNLSGKKSVRHILEEKIHCAASKIEEIFFKYSVYANFISDYDLVEYMYFVEYMVGNICLCKFHQ